MYAAIVFLPLLGFLIAGPFGWRIGARPSEIVTTSFLLVVALLSWIVFFQVALGTAPASVSVLGNWFTSGTLKVDWSLKIDSLTAVMLVVVTTVSSLVHLYSIGYMADDPSRPVIIHGVQHVFHAPLRLPAWPDADHTTRIVLILRDMEQAFVETLWKAAAGVASPDCPDRAALTASPLAPCKGGLLA